MDMFICIYVKTCYKSTIDMTEAQKLHDRLGAHLVHTTSPGAARCTCCMLL
jgi:hypothetical protein